MINKKILILYATAGIGHKKAAFAIKEAFDEIAAEGIGVTILDALDYTNAFFKWTYLKLYLLMVNRLPLLWGLSYYLTDNFYLNILIAYVRRLNNWLNSGKLVRYILDSKPDVIIATHFFASEVISDLKKKAGLKSHLITVVTDYKLHTWWVSDYVDTYIVGSTEAKIDLVQKGIASARVEVLGIPVGPVFTKELDRKSIFERTDLNEGFFTILVIGGGFGVGPIEEIVKIISRIPEPVQTIVICGHNENLMKRIESLKTGFNAIIKTLGFVDNVYDYMEIADILISKSGGITVAESLAKELPMIIIRPIIGQETRNASFLIRAGAAIKITRISNLKDCLEGLIKNEEEISDMKESIRMIKRPRASYDIAKLAIEISGSSAQ